ncbi:MAG: ATP-binding cassette domain-containing protein [Spirochaetia bacterium]|nr:ATP-binding cassette domain-containing protein [Spirochaetia bacterium]
MIIEIKDLNLDINNFQILKNINLCIEKGETIVLLGKNGSGKTMLLKTIIGLYKPNSGSVKIFDKDINNLSKTEQTDMLRQMGYVFQKSGLFDSLNIAENVVFALRRFQPETKEWLLQKAIDLLKSAGLENVEKKSPAELSGGMQKRAGIARAIAMDPAILLMDDPTAGLDPVLSDAIAELIVGIRERIKSSIIVVTHDLKIAYKLGHRIGLMHDGNLISIMQTGEFLKTDNEYISQFRSGNLEGPIPVLD